MSNVENETLTINDFNKVCRTCSAQSVLTPLFENADMLNLLQTYTQIQFYENDGLPYQICRNCIIRLNQIYLFVNTCKSVDTVFRKCMNEHYSKLNAETENIILDECGIKQENDSTGNLENEMKIEHIEINCTTPVKQKPSGSDDSYTEYCNEIEWENGFNNYIENTDHLENRTTEKPDTIENIEIRVEINEVNGVSKKKYSSATHSSFRKSNRGRKKCSVFRRSVFLLHGSNFDLFPAPDVQTYIQKLGLGKAANSAEILRQWSIEQIKSYLLTLYSEFISNMIYEVGFVLGKCSKNRKLTALPNVSNARDLEKEIGQGSIIILPNENLTDNLSMWQKLEANQAE